MKKCPQCQQESLDEAHFCANCGASLDPPKKLSRQAKRKQVDTKESDLPTESSSTPSPSQDQETSSPSSQEKKEPSKEKSVKDSSQEFKKEETKDKDDQDSKEKQEEKKDKEPKWHSFLFQKKEENEEEEDEDEEGEDHPEDMQRMLFIAVCFLGLLVIFLSGLLIYQDFSSNIHEEGEVVVQNQPSLSEETLETYSIQKESSASTQSKTSEVSTKTFSLTHEEGRVLPRRAGESREESSTQSSKESSEEKSSTKSSTTTSSSSASYQANYVMNVRSGPSIDEDQVSQIDEGDIVDVDKTKKNSDGSTWGRLEGSENWVCLSDSDTEYFTELTSQRESAPVAKVDLDDLIEQAGGSIWNLFDDAVLIGDSRVYGFMSYGFIPSNQVLAAGGYTIQNISEYLNFVALLQPDVIYLSFGINDMGLNIGQDEGENGYAKVYTRQIEALLDRDPGATIVVNSVIDATPSAVANSPRWNKVAEFNRQIKQMCKENNWIYVDNDPLAQGGNAPIYNADGVHLVSTFYEPWAKNMLKARYA